MALDEEDDITLEGGEGVTSPLAPSGMEQRLSGTGANSEAILQALLSQALRTGSQGDARPSYAADAANAQTRVAKILSAQSATVLAIMMPPVSVCHQVSTIGQRDWPTFL